MNYDEIENLLKLAQPFNMSGRKVWVLNDGNMMSAINWFKKITGEEFLLPVPVRVRQTEDGPVTSQMPTGTARALSIGALAAKKDAAKAVTVTLRGGSSSVLEAATGNKHAGPPTLEVQGAEKLKSEVPTFKAFGGSKKIIVEVKFTTLADRTPVPVK